MKQYEADGVQPIIDETIRKRLVITVKGGQVENIVTAIPGAECLIIDHDVDSVNLEELRNCPICDLDCHLDIVDTQFNPKLVEDCFKCIDDAYEDRYERAIKLIQAILYSDVDETGKRVINPDKSWSPDSLDEIAQIVNQIMPLEK